MHSRRTLYTLPYLRPYETLPTTFNPLSPFYEMIGDIPTARGTTKGFGEARLDRRAKKAKHTTVGIPLWSPTRVLVHRFKA